MSNQKLFKTGFIARLKTGLADNLADTIDLYRQAQFDYSAEDVCKNLHIKERELKFRLPDRTSNYDFENAQALHEHYKALSPMQATDARIWTYMAHVPFWDYMKARWLINFEDGGANAYIMQHWFLDGISAKNLLRHGIAALWWTAYMTYDETRDEPYELTREIFTMLDYSRTLLPGKLGRNDNFRHAILEFIIENKPLFKSYKEAKVRALMRRMNLIASYRKIYSLEKNDIKELLEKYKNEIQAVSS